MSPSSGTLETCSLVCSSIRPPSTTVSPLLTSTAFLTVRVSKVGPRLAVPAAWAWATLETSCSMLSKTESPSLIWGVTTSLVPTVLRSMVLNT
ncbi:hypothetical protein D3C84_888720 [compost metagenome]